MRNAGCDEGLDLGRRHIFDQVLPNTHPKSVDGARHFGVTGEQDDADIVEKLLVVQPLDHLVARRSRHVLVEDDRVEKPAFCL